MSTTFQAYGRAFLVVGTILLASGSGTAEFVPPPQLMPDGLVIKANLQTRAVNSGVRGGIDFALRVRLAYRGLVENEILAEAFAWCQRNWEKQPLSRQDVEECAENRALEVMHRPTNVGYAVSIKGDRLRVDSEGVSMLAALATDGSIAEWGILDPGTTPPVATPTRTSWP